MVGAAVVASCELFANNSANVAGLLVVVVVVANDLSVVGTDCSVVVVVVGSRESRDRSRRISGGMASLWLALLRFSSVNTATSSLPSRGSAPTEAAGILSPLDKSSFESIKDVATVVVSETVAGAAVVVGVASGVKIGCKALVRFPCSSHCEMQPFVQSSTLHERKTLSRSGNLNAYIERF